MISRYFTEDTRILYGAPGDCYHAATAANAAAAASAAKMLNDAQWLNDAKRRYTAAARLIAKAETTEGFTWEGRE